MKKRIVFASLVVLALFSIVLSGCGKKGVPAGAVDETRPVAEVTAEAELMTVAQLGEMATKYLAAIEGKNAELTAMMKTLSESSKAGTVNRDFMKIKEDITNITSSLTSLQERFGVYYDKLVELKADVSGLK